MLERFQSIAWLCSATIGQDSEKTWRCGRWSVGLRYAVQVPRVIDAPAATITNHELDWVVEDLEVYHDRPTGQPPNEVKCPANAHASAIRLEYRHIMDRVFIGSRPRARMSSQLIYTLRCVSSYESIPLPLLRIIPIPAISNTKFIYQRPAPFIQSRHGSQI